MYYCLHCLYVTDIMAQKVPEPQCVFATRVWNTLEAPFTSHYPRTGLTTCERTLDLRGRIAEIIVYLPILGTTAYTTRYREVVTVSTCQGNDLDHGNQDLIRDFHCIPLRIREVELQFSLSGIVENKFRFIPVSYNYPTFFLVCFIFSYLFLMSWKIPRIRK